MVLATSLGGNKSYNEPVGRMSEESSPEERARDESVADNGRQPD